MKDPYINKDSDVLINKANLKEKDKLDEFENRMTNLALVILMIFLISIKSYLKMYTNELEKQGQQTFIKVNQFYKV